jgi:plasmid maintenance system antidote protein VapI
LICQAFQADAEDWRGFVITGDTALRVGHFFGNSPQFWLNLQAIYDLRTAQEAVGKKTHALPTLNDREAA